MIQRLFTSNLFVPQARIDELLSDPMYQPALIEFYTAKRKYITALKYLQDEGIKNE